MQRVTDCCNCNGFRCEFGPGLPGPSIEFPVGPPPSLPELHALEINLDAKGRVLRSSHYNTSVISNNNKSNEKGGILVKLGWI
jgi:hypothetical protein